LQAGAVEKAWEVMMGEPLSDKDEAQTLTHHREADA